MIIVHIVIFHCCFERMVASLDGYEYAFLYGDLIEEIFIPSLWLASFLFLLRFVA